MDTIPLTSLNRLLLSTFLKNCTFCHNSRDKKGTFTFEEYQQIQIAAATGHDSTDVFRALLVKLIEQPEEQQTFERLLETAEKFAAKYE